ncbi:alpha/beta hydrolase [uncultured Subdoligranulum sp.]|uniref:alpha/beta hydrolase n=1 Tax=uncultured Subdoligranulum sp. TaxID=512298 RepID=UPI00345B4DAF
MYRSRAGRLRPRRRLGPGSLLPPLFADLRGLPPTLTQAGGREILRDDSTRLYEKLQAAGVPAVLQTWPDMWHVFQMFPLKAAGEAMDQMARYLELLR